jgi:hypothetical protein
LAEPVPAANEAANADDEGPSPQLELGLDPAPSLLRRSRLTRSPDARDDALRRPSFPLRTVSENEPGHETFLSHLIELRNRLLWSVLAVGIVFLCLVPWAKDIYHIISAPMLAQLPQGGRMIATEITSPFFIPFKVTFLTAVVIALPVLLYQAWAFVAPGLYVHEKRLVLPLIAPNRGLG